MTASNEYNLIPLYTLKAVREQEVQYQYPTCKNASQAAAILNAYLRDKECEYLVVLMTDNQFAFLGMSVVTIGTIHGCQTIAREIYKHAIVHRAHSIILGHNHPSGMVTPSSEDIIFTKQVADAGKLLGCPLNDHIIISSGQEEGYYSFSDKGLL